MSRYCYYHVPRLEDVGGHLVLEALDLLIAMYTITISISITTMFTVVVIIIMCSSSSSSSSNSSNNRISFIMGYYLY